MCLYPRIIKNRKYTANKKNKGIIPTATDKRTEYVPVGCGKCIECMKQKANHWKVRLFEEIRTNHTGKFVTLTFNNESYIELAKEIEIDGYARENAIVTLACRRFLERWRKKYKVSVKHWLVSELGSGRYEHVHLHGIIYSDEVEAIKEKWAYGYVFIGQYVNEKSINYMVKYIHKQDLEHKLFKPKILTSDGIGHNYTNTYNAKLNKYNENKTTETYTLSSGHQISLPIYWRNKIYTEEEREKLWLHRLDKEERYVCGEKIDMKQPHNKGWKKYWKLLEYHRKRNTELGYGNGKTQWNREKYEMKNRAIMQETRIQRAINTKGTKKQQDKQRTA